MATQSARVPVWAPGVPRCHGAGQSIQGFQEVPALCFCQQGLPALQAKGHVQGDHFPASEATNFFGNARGSVLKGSLFP